MSIVYPASYTTSSTNNSDLNGTMVLSDAETVESYKSDVQGDATKVTNHGGSGLDFNLEFGTGSNKLKYKITADEEDDGDSYDGDWLDDSAEGGVGGTGDDWEATAIIPPEPDPPEASGISGARY